MNQPAIKNSNTGQLLFEKIMPRSSGSSIISEIGVGGQGGQNINIASDENQNWWTSKMPFCPPTTTISPIELAISSSPAK